MTVRLHNYAEVRAYLEKEHPDRLRALTPRHINAPADYWPQKVLAVSSANAAMQNYIDIHQRQTKPNPVLAAMQGQAARAPASRRSNILCGAGTLGCRASDRASL